MSYGSWFIEQLKFTGENDVEASLQFSPGLNLIYGASNTGKSFAFQALDFMLGGQKVLPNISERSPYNSLWLDITLAPETKISLERSLLGGPFQLHQADFGVRTLAAKHDAKNSNNISTFLLKHINSDGRQVSIDASGTKHNLSFRDIAHIILTNEISIQSEKSPAEFRERDQIKERNVFKYILTGVDDSKLISSVKPKEFKLKNSAKISMLQDLIDQIESTLSAEYPFPEELELRLDKLDDTFGLIEGEIAEARSSVILLLDEKRNLTSKINDIERRKMEVSLSLHSFEQLVKVYESDIERLEALEEASFLLNIDNNCSLCGATAKDQLYSRPSIDIETIRAAAEVEIFKIKKQLVELINTINETKSEESRLYKTMDALHQLLCEVELKIEKSTPILEEQKNKLREIVTLRDQIRKGIDLLSQKKWLIDQMISIKNLRAPRKKDTVKSALSTETAKAFADQVSHVLKAWGYPGADHVVFDISTYDLIINGKERRNNGKGVRAIIHSAFKVALLLFCRERGLPHPGILVLDTPLLTYRDPMKQVGDKLTSDEEALRSTNLKEKFFQHLGSLGKDTQIIIFENIDPPKDIKNYCLVETFTDNHSTGRQGLL